MVLVGWSAAGLATPLLADPAVTAWLERPGDAPHAGPFRWLVGCRFLLGLFEAGHWPCALLTARHVLSAKDRPLGNGLLQSGATAGAVLIPLYVLGLRRLGGDWQVVFWTVGAAGLLWVPLWLAVVRPGDLPAGRVQSAPAADDTGPRGADLARMLATLAVVVTGLNVSWQFLRAWLPKYLREYQGFDEGETTGATVAYYLAADAGCILSGALVRWRAGRGVPVHAARAGGFVLFAGITAAAAAVPLVGDRWAAAALLVVAGAGILGLHPYYYALVQDLPGRHVGVFGGALAAVGWAVLAVFQVVIGSHIEATKSYAAGLVVAGLAPLAGLLALLTLWPRPRPAG